MLDYLVSFLLQIYITHLFVLEIKVFLSLENFQQEQLVNLHS